MRKLCFVLVFKTQTTEVEFLEFYLVHVSRKAAWPCGLKF